MSTYAYILYDERGDRQPGVYIGQLNDNGTVPQVIRRVETVMPAETACEFGEASDAAVPFQNVEFTFWGNDCITHAGVTQMVKAYRRKDVSGYSGRR